MEQDQKKINDCLLEASLKSGEIEFTMETVDYEMNSLQNRASCDSIVASVGELESRLRGIDRLLDKMILQTEEMNSILRSVRFIERNDMAELKTLAVLFLIR